MTFLWYDLETFGGDSRYDRISQFAAVRTDEQLTVVEEPVVLYGKLSPDYLPDPLACLITGITPQQTENRGLTEAELAREMEKHFSRPGTCAVGFNSIRFDDEFVRNLFYRNFFDPYRREWADGNSRWDIIDLARATRDLRPAGIHWPTGETGWPTVKLELLSQANDLVHDRAHDALSDVYATIAVAKLIKEKQPKLYSWAVGHRTKEQIRPLIDLAERTPLVHTSSMFCSERGCTTLVAPLAVDPNRRNVIYAFDLRSDPGPLLELPPEEVRRRIFTRREELEAEGIERVPLKGIHVNKVPFLAPRAVLDKAAAQRLGIDTALADERHRRLQRAGDLIGRIREIFSEGPDYPAVDDPDLQIYERFFPDEDRSILDEIRSLPPTELPGFRLQTKDPRVPEMLRRYIGRNHPGVLDEEGRKRWRSYCASRILFPPLPGASDLGEYRKRLAAWQVSDELEAAKKWVIKDLEEYGNRLEREILDSGSAGTFGQTKDHQQEGNDE